MWKEIINFSPFDEEIFIHVFSRILNTENIEKNSTFLSDKYDFERLEFLGDTILNMVISEKIFNDFPKASPGSLTKLRSRLVRNETLYDIVKQMKIFEKLQKNSDIDQCSLQLNFESVKTRADFFECLIGTIYEDQGFFFTKNWIENIYNKYNIKDKVLNDDNYVDILQMVTKSNLPLFTTTITNEKKTRISCVYNDKQYISEGVYKPHVKQNCCLMILKDLIDKGIISNSIFDFKYD